MELHKKALNIVELIADGDCAYDQPCKFGYRVEHHAVYCHNTTWLYAPRKCTFCSRNGDRHQDCQPHATCPGFAENKKEDAGNNN